MLLIVMFEMDDGALTVVGIVSRYAGIARKICHEISSHQCPSRY
jgi:hypothetical protein